MIHHKNKIFIVLAVFITIAAVYHLLGIFYNLDHLPVWRHAIFMTVDLFCVYGLIKRPGYFVVLFIVFTIQQYYSHAPYLVETWQNQHAIHWKSVFVLALLPIALTLLIADYFSQFDNLISFKVMEDSL